MDEMEEVTQTAKAEVLRMGYHKPVVAFYGVKLNGEKSRGLFFIETSAYSLEAKAAVMYTVGMKLGSDKVFSRLDKVFLVSDDWIKVAETSDQSKESEMIVGLHICCLDLETNNQTSRTFEYIKDEKGNVKELKPDKRDFETNNPMLSAFVAGFNTG